jgi:hypothetical protein
VDGIMTTKSECFWNRVGSNSIFTIRLISAFIVGALPFLIYLLWFFLVKSENIDQIFKVEVGVIAAIVTFIWLPIIGIPFVDCYIRGRDS